MAADSAVPSWEGVNAPSPLVQCPASSATAPLSPPPAPLICWYSAPSPLVRRCNAAIFGASFVRPLWIIGAINELV